MSSPHCGNKLWMGCDTGHCTCTACLACHDLSPCGPHEEQLERFWASQYRMTKVVVTHHLGGAGGAAGALPARFAVPYD